MFHNLPLFGFKEDFFYEYVSGAFNGHPTVGSVGYRKYGR